MPLSKRSQSKKAANCIILTILHSGTDKTGVNKKISVFQKVGC